MERGRQIGFSASRTVTATDHTPGDRNSLQPIRPYYVTSTTYYVPQIEEVLVRDFTRGKRHHQHISLAIFTPDLKKSRDTLSQHSSMWRLVPFYCSQPGDIADMVQDVAANAELLKTDVYEKSDAVGYDVDPYDPNVLCLLWDHPFLKEHATTLDPLKYSYAITVWLRINCACMLPGTSTPFYARNPYTRDKLKRYCDNHLQAVKYLDSFADPSDDHIDVDILCALVKPLGNSYYSEDRGSIRVEERMILQQLPTPLQVLVEAFPATEWNPERISNCYSRYANGEATLHYDPLRSKALANPSTYTIYMGCILVLDDIANKQHDDNMVQDALHYYYVAFVDLFWFCINHADYCTMSDTCLVAPMQHYTSMTAWELFNPYKSDTRAFHAGDLPDLFGVLTDIPLHGEQHKSSFTIGKVIQKCLPFCGQRRKLIEVVCAHNMKEPAFWNVFCKVVWCMLAGMYPGDKERPKMTELLRIRQLTDASTAKDVLNDALSKGEYEGSALIVFTAFRKYILYMADENVHYVEEANKCVDWDVLRSDTIKRAELIRGSNLFPDDPFGRARILLTKMHKNNSKLDVYRYRKSSCIKTLGKFLFGVWALVRAPCGR